MRDCDGRDERGGNTTPAVCLPPAAAGRWRTIPQGRLITRISWTLYGCVSLTGQHVGQTCFGGGGAGAFLDSGSASPRQVDEGHVFVVSTCDFTTCFEPTSTIRSHEPGIVTAGMLILKPVPRWNVLINFLSGSKRNRLVGGQPTTAVAKKMKVVNAAEINNPEWRRFFSWGLF